MAANFQDYLTDDEDLDVRGTRPTSGAVNRPVARSSQPKRRVSPTAKRSGPKVGGMHQRRKKRMSW